MQRDVIAGLEAFDAMPIDRTALPQERLDLVSRSRTSLFPWRGQFSPEFVELLVREFASPGDIIGDPFVGSGSTLFEAIRLGHGCYGAEINPSALLMAQTVHFTNLQPVERQEYLSAAYEILEADLPPDREPNLFSFLLENSPRYKGSTDVDCLRAMAKAARGQPYVEIIVGNVITRYLSGNNRNGSTKLLGAFRTYEAIVESLPSVNSPCVVEAIDARHLSVQDGALALVITSPPYINVFNYHQNNRGAMELMGWDLLNVARSEIGSNRKHRGNRFLTVIQYCLDMTSTLHELRRAVCQNGRVIVVIGRESNVRGVSFF